MIKGIDHVVMLVEDLETASADYRSLGFTVLDGGEHADGRSHNSLVVFADDSYLELISFRGPVPQSHMFYRAHGQEGLITYALLPGDITSDVEAARQRGLALQGPRHGGRLRPDGQQLAWNTVTPVTHDLPFLCADVTTRELRVPGGEARVHPNGVLGITAVTLVVADLDASVERYHALLGSEPLSDFGVVATHRGVAAFQAGGATITLIEPDAGAMLAHLVGRGEGPYSITLRSRRGEATSMMALAKTHGARLEVVPWDEQA